MELKIKDIVGANCITQTAGAKVLNLIVDHLKNEQNVVVDFEGVEIFASPFFNSAFGRLYEYFRNDVLNDKLKIVNLNSDALHIVVRVLENAREYYAKAAIEQNRQDDAVTKAVTEE